MFARDHKVLDGGGGLSSHASVDDQESRNIRKMEERERVDGRFPPPGLLSISLSSRPRGKDSEDSATL